jgi:hypothetical protein
VVRGHGRDIQEARCWSKPGIRDPLRGDGALHRKALK